ncbi:hypothetical protein HWV07_08510 [Natronomonas salina]|uniref:hypothetical protein n=1 Tax=Natronomonas salina TaxID=1710540 RepID=UPI0015B39922|nr:hypothetical protein [Natronomonas salina]QLD89068.1 hypothetical protein HWV07_08510 [Natronomonas salina]
MSLHDGQRRASHTTNPVVFEFAIVTAVFGGLYLWQEALRGSILSLFDLSFGGVLADGLVYTGLFLGGLAAFAVPYARYRGIRIGLSLPTRTDARVLGLAAVGPVALAALTKLVGVLTGVSYSSLTMTAVAADAPLTPVLAIAGLGILLGTPALVIVCQVLVQGSFEQAVGSTTAVVLTPLVAGFALLSETGGLGPVPDLGKLIGVVLFTLLLAGSVAGAQRIGSGRRRILAATPVALFVAVVVLSGIAEIESVAGGLFVLLHFAVLGIAAYGYERSDSLLVPAVTYTSLLLANSLIVYFFEAGMQSW